MELHRTEVKNAIYSALLSEELRQFIKMPKNYAEDYFEDLALNIANDYVTRIFDLNELL